MYNLEQYLKYFLAYRFQRFRLPFRFCLSNLVLIKSQFPPKQISRHSCCVSQTVFPTKIDFPLPKKIFFKKGRLEEEEEETASQMVSVTLLLMLTVSQLPRNLRTPPLKNLILDCSASKFWQHDNAPDHIAMRMQK